MNAAVLVPHEHETAGHVVIMPPFLGIRADGQCEVIAAFAAAHGCHYDVYSIYTTSTQYSILRTALSYYCCTAARVSVCILSLSEDFWGNFLRKRSQFAGRWGTLILVAASRIEPRLRDPHMLRLLVKKADVLLCESLPERFSMHWSGAPNKATFHKYSILVSPTPGRRFRL